MMMGSVLACMVGPPPLHLPSLFPHGEFFFLVTLLELQGTNIPSFERKKKEKGFFFIFD